MKPEMVVKGTVRMGIEALGFFNAEQLNEGVAAGEINEVDAIEMAFKTCASLNMMERLCDSEDFFALREEFFKICKRIDANHQDCVNPQCRVTLFRGIMENCGKACNVIVNQKGVDHES